MPEISIITPSLNSAGFIGDCLRSVAAQGIDCEHIVVDGESTDGTQQIVEKSGYGARILELSPTGIFPAINSGIRKACGEIVGVLNADDFYATDDVLGRVASVFREPSVEICYGDLCYVQCSDTTRVVRYWRAGSFQPSRMRHGWMPPHPTFFVRRQVYDKYGLYRIDMGTAADYELMLRLLVRYDVRAAYIPKVLVHMRTGGASNISIRARVAANRMDRKAWRVNGLRPYPWTVIAKPLLKVGQWWRRPTGY